MKKTTLAVTVLLVVGLLDGCTVEGLPVLDTGADAGADASLVVDAGGCRPGSTSRCEGQTSISCRDDGSEERESCSSDLRCVPEFGCVVCRPGAFRCLGEELSECADDGLSWQPSLRCSASEGLQCDIAAGACSNACARAAEARSYIGCEYWPTVTSNDQLDQTRFGFAIAVSNPQSVAVPLSIEWAGGTMSETVAAGAVEVVSLPWVEALRAPGGAALVRGGAFRVRSSLPVVVYQFNPLEFQSARSFSYTNDASLLLPTTALSTEYVVVSRNPLVTRSVADPTMMRSSSGFLSVTATGAGTTTVTVVPTASTLASVSGGISAIAAGEEATFTLRASDVLQLVSSAPETCSALVVDDVRTVCDGAGFDLTGTRVRASQPVQVTSGHNCAFVPETSAACDHLEEVLFPVDSWGNEVFATVAARGGEANLVRVVSATDGNDIVFDPPLHPPVTLDAGEFVEFEAAFPGVKVSGSAAIEVAQFLIGQTRTGALVGDPSLLMGIPSEQYRTDYTVFSPVSYTENYVTLSVPLTATVILDGAPIDTGTYRPIGASGYAAATIAVPGGAHVVTGSAPFGLIMHGYGSFTSYAYSGGLDLEQINVE